MVDFLVSLTFYLFLIDLGILYISFFAFGYCGNGTGYDILAVLVMLGIVLIPTIIWKTTTKTKKYK